MKLTLEELRLIVFRTSTVYAEALRAGKSVQTAEWVRMAELTQVLRDLHLSTWAEHNTAAPYTPPKGD